MADANADGVDGTLFRGPDGALYFVRADLLEVCKVEAELTETCEDLLGGDVEGFVAGPPTARSVTLTPGPNSGWAQAFHASGTAPNLPSGYDLKGRVGP